MLPPAVVVGASGRIGSVISRGPNAIAVTRSGPTLKECLPVLPPVLPPAGKPGGSGRLPIFVATTNNALEQVIAGCPAASRPDLCFLQNGMLLPLLDRHGLAGNTQALVYFSAAADGSVVDSGRTVVCGRWAEHLCDRLHALGIACQALHQREYLARMVEKLLWASVYWLLSSALGGMPVGQVARQHGDAAREVVAELLPLAQAYVLRQARGGGLAQLGPGCVDEVASLTVEGVAAAMQSYSLAIPTAVPSKSMALAEMEWRNGWFVQQARTPAHAAWLERAGVEA